MAATNTIRQYSLLNVTIAAGASGISTAVQIGGNAIVGLVMPATWVPAAITFQTSANYPSPTADAAFSPTWVNIYLDDAATELTIPAAAAVQGLALAPNTILTKLSPFNWIRLRSGTSAAPVNQTATRVIQLLLKS